MKVRLFLYEVEPPEGWRWLGRACVPETRPYGNCGWRGRFRRVPTKRRGFGLIEACPPGTILRQYRYHRPNRTYFLERVWVGRVDEPCPPTGARGEENDVR